MEAETKQKLIEYQKSKGYGITDDELIETITDAKTLWEGRIDRHRWYTLIPSVVCVGDIFILYNRCDVHGEQASVEDCIGGYKLENMKEVKPVQKMVTVYE